MVQMVEVKGGLLQEATTRLFQVWSSSVLVILLKTQILRQAV